MDNCIFCKIGNHEIPGKVVYEDDLCMAFLDLSQTTDGHTLVIPKKHYANYLEVDDQTLAHMSCVVKKVANELCKKLQASGVNILSNAGVCAGQTVMHFHMHIIPRYDDHDGISIAFTDRSNSVDLDALLDKIR